MKNKTILYSIDEVILVLGGPRVACVKMGIGRSAVSMWKKRNQIPLTQVIPVLLALSNRGYALSSDLLNVRGVSGALFAAVYQPPDESELNESQKRHNAQQGALDFAPAAE